MTMFIAEAAAALALMAAGPAVDVQPAPAAKRLYVCQSDAATKRAFKRQYGEAMKFETARSVLSAGDARWDAPRCITAGELRRLDALSENVVYAGDTPASPRRYGTLIATSTR